MSSLKDAQRFRFLISASNPDSPMWAPLEKAYKENELKETGSVEENEQAFRAMIDQVIAELKFEEGRPETVEMPAVPTLRLLERMEGVVGQQSSEAWYKYHEQKYKRLIKEGAIK